MIQSSPLAIFIFALAASVGAVVSPGPVSAAIITETPLRGWRAGPLIATGHVFLELIFIALISIGLTSGVAKGNILRVIAYGGSLLFFYMGGSYLNLAIGKKAKLTKLHQTQGSSQNSNLIFIGMLTTISNPFWYLWWVTIVSGYLARIVDLNFMAIAAFYFGHISVDYLWDTFLSALIFWGRRWLTDRIYRILLLFTGGFMIYLGIMFLKLGIGY